MEFGFKGHLKSIGRDLYTKEYQVVFMTDTMPQIDITDEELDIKATTCKKKRSLNANAYAWALIGKISDVLKADKQKVYEDLLGQYGQIERNGDEAIIIRVKEGIELPFYTKLIGQFYEAGQCFNEFLLIKGSHEYNTAEMATFIDGIVSEAKWLGIETLPPAELERMVKIWKA